MNNLFIPRFTLEHKLINISKMFKLINYYSKITSHILFQWIQYFYLRLFYRLLVDWNQLTFYFLLNNLQNEIYFYFAEDIIKH